MVAVDLAVGGGPLRSGAYLAVGPTLRRGSSPFGPVPVRRRTDMTGWSLVNTEPTAEVDVSGGPRRPRVVPPPQRALWEGDDDARRLERGVDGASHFVGCHEALADRGFVPEANSEGDG